MQQLLVPQSLQLPFVPQHGSLMLLIDRSRIGGRVAANFPMQNVQLAHLG